MFKKAKPFFIKVITPLHAGSGQDLGVVDLPIQRERHTGFPKIEASGLKGSIREVFGGYLIKKEKDDNGKIVITFDIDEFLKEKLQNEELHKKLQEEWKVINKKEDEIEKEIHYTRLHEAISLLFGPEDTDNAHAGALGFTDARIFLFPVKSAKGVFAWVTCPKVLERFKQDMELTDENLSLDLSKINVSDGECLVADNEKLVINDAVILEEYAFKKKGEIDKAIINAISKKTKIDTLQLLILSNDDFTDFVNFSTEVITRTRIDNETGTVDKKTGGLWTEEYLPSETIMYSLVLANPIFNSDKGIFNEQDKPEEERVLEFWSNSMPDVMQIGGNATIGKGIVEILGLREAQK